GFKGQSLSGDSGLWWRNDLRLTLPPTTLGPIDRTLGRAYVGLGYDIGKIKTDPRDLLERGIASGISASLGTSGGPLGLSLTWAQEVRSPAFLTAKNNAVYFSASLTF
ncbi:MAG: ShlB/FhaC/HecB family hemolysin secretion/activation protein, partial [Bacteroidetes bacterium]|nr:ShlB/FhaC/HecB family hemolysin secretion/activation protein [Bacteroidota bacterium]